MRKYILLVMHATKNIGVGIFSYFPKNVDDVFVVRKMHFITSGIATACKIHMLTAFIPMYISHPHNSIIMYF